MRLHLGAGTVYLKGWINVDMVGDLAKDRPDKVAHNLTTLDRYYKYKFRANKHNFVCDVHDDARYLTKFKDNSIDKILSVNLIDHMTRQEFLKMLDVWKKKLRRGGKLIIDVDDRQQQAKLLSEAKTYRQTQWVIRLFYCHQRTIWDYHFWGYTPISLKHILIKKGFKHLWIKNDYIVHDRYPNFQICVEKI